MIPFYPSIKSGFSKKGITTPRLYWVTVLSQNLNYCVGAFDLTRQHVIYYAIKKGILTPTKPIGWNSLALRLHLGLRMATPQWSVGDTIIKRILLNSIPTFINWAGHFSRTIRTFALRQMRLLRPKSSSITPQKTLQRPSLHHAERFQRPAVIISNAFNRGHFLSTRFLVARQKHRTASCCTRSWLKK